MLSSKSQQAMQYDNFRFSIVSIQWFGNRNHVKFVHSFCTWILNVKNTNETCISRMKGKLFRIQTLEAIARGWSNASSQIYYSLQKHSSSSCDGRNTLSYTNIRSYCKGGWSNASCQMYYSLQKHSSSCHDERKTFSYTKIKSYCKGVKQCF